MDAFACVMSLQPACVCLHVDPEMELINGRSEEGLMRSDPNRREKWPYSTVLTEPNSYIPHKTCNVSNPTPPTYHIKQRKVKWNPTQGCQTLMLTGEELGRNGGSLLLFLLPEDSWGELPVPCKAPSSDQTQKLLPHLVLALNTFIYNGSSIWSHLTGFCLSLSLSLSLPPCLLARKDLAEG